MDKKAKILRELKGFLFMIVGCCVYAFGTSVFIAPKGIIAGGVTGLSVMINFINSKLPIGMISIAVNIPIMLLGVKFQGWKFIIRCFITTTTLGVVTDLFSVIPVITENEILAALYGGLCQGIGIGLFVKYQFSSGGTELLGRLLSKLIKSLNIATCTGILDGIIVISGAIVTKTPENMLYALIVVFVCTKVSEVIIVGLDKSKMCIIITDKGREISKALIEKSPRGITMMDGKGMYTEAEKDVLLTCVKNPQLSKLKDIVKEIDEHAFIIVNEAVEVRGKGFRLFEDND